MNQLVMEIPSETSYLPEDYIVSESNRLAHGMLMRWPDWQHYGMWLSGPESSGKTHLAHVWQSHSQAIYVQTEDTQKDIEPFVQAYGAFIVDDDISDFNPDWLFHFLNAVKAHQKTLLVVQTERPEVIDWATPDVASRVKSFARCELSYPDDMLLRGVMMKMLSDRQLRMVPEAIDYLLKRMGRSFAELQHCVEVLDKKALEHQQRLTLPFVRKWYDEMMGG